MLMAGAGLRTKKPGSLKSSAFVLSDWSSKLIYFWRKSWIEKIAKSRQLQMLRVYLIEPLFR